MDNNFENSNSFTEENGSENSVPNAEKAGNTFEQSIGPDSQNTTAQSQQYTGSQTGAPPFTPPPYTSYYDTNNGYFRYGAAPQKKQAEKVKSKNKKIGIAVAAAIIAVSLICVSVFGVFALRNKKANLGNNDNKEKIEAEIPLADADKGNAAEGTAQAIYQKAYESNVGVLVYANNKSTIASEGSGVVLPTVISGGDSSKTYIVTCAHVLETSSAYKTVVRTHDGEQYDAKIVGVDRKTDIGVIYVESAELKAAEFASSSNIMVGDTVYALGNPGGSTFFGSFTNGMVSAIGRPVDSPVGYEVSCIQHTSAINPGNSGGALLNSEGQVIGINSSKIASTEYEGMGFAVPSETVKEIAENIIANGYVTGRAVLGITYYPSTYSQVHSAIVQSHDLPSGSLIIRSISSQSDLANKDVKEGDLVIGFNGKDLENYADLLDFIENSSVGDKLTLKICRIDQNYKLNIFEVETKLVEDTGDVIENNG